MFQTEWNQATAKIFSQHELRCAPPAIADHAVSFASFCLYASFLYFPFHMTKRATSFILLVSLVTASLCVSTPEASATTTDFTITTPTLAIGAGTPSRAITLAVIGGPVGASTASFALSDGGAGGTFYPSSPVTIAASSASGATTQFVYIAPPNASGSITIQAIATGGISATHTLTLPIGTATMFVHDTFSGIAGTNLTSP